MFSQQQQPNGVQQSPGSSCLPLPKPQNAPKSYGEQQQQPVILGAGVASGNGINSSSLSSNGPNNSDTNTLTAGTAPSLIPNRTDSTNVASGSLTAPTMQPTNISFDGTATLASVFGQPQHQLLGHQQIPLLSQQSFVEQLQQHIQQQTQQQTLQQQQQNQQQQHTSTSAPNEISKNPAIPGNGSSNNTVPMLSATMPGADPQVLWQHAIQSLAGGGAAAGQLMGTAAAAAAAAAAASSMTTNGATVAMNQQQQQFQQLMASLPMPTELTQLALMYPLQQAQQPQPTQNLSAIALTQPQAQFQLQQQPPAPQQPQYQLQSAVGPGQPLRPDFANGSHFMNNSSNMGSAVAVRSSSSNNANNDLAVDVDRKPKNGENKRNGGGPSIVSFNSNMCDFGFNEKPPERKSDRELEKMSESERRRYERNLREQQRSYKISQQIKQLRDVLAESNIPFRPNKYSILVSVAEYIKQLQSRAIMLDAEHQRLIDTIRKTNEIVSSGVPMNLSDDDESNNEQTSSRLQAGFESETSSLLLVQGIDYRNVFDHCPYPMGIATLDGRVLAANEGFEDLLCCARGQMVDQSLFVYIRNHQEIFEAMAALLKRSTLGVETGERTFKEQELLYWSGQVMSPRNQRVPFTITLTSTADNNPKYFSLSAGAAAME